MHFGVTISDDTGAALIWIIDVSILNLHVWLNRQRLCMQRRIEQLARHLLDGGSSGIVADAARASADITAETAIITVDVCGAA